MSDYPKMVYRGEPRESWEALGKAIHARQVEMIIVQDESEEEARAADGFGSVGALIVSEDKARKKPRKGESGAAA